MAEKIALPSIHPVFMPSLNNPITKDIIADISFVVHCAACVKHYGDANYFKKINVDGTETIAKICFNNKVSRLCSKFYIPIFSIFFNLLGPCP